jgi:hypothetical protein
MEKNQVLEAYQKYWLENGHQPTSVYSFCQLINCSEKDFYDQFNSLEALDSEIWLSIFQTTIAQLEQDEIYRNYSAREKLLAFYFLWIQKLKENRSYLLLQKTTIKLTELHENLGLFKEAFEKYIDTIIKSGYDSHEIKERKYISDQYPKGFWLQAMFVLKYWMDDRSKNFEMTDAAIEKAVDLSFRLIGENTLDSLFDFGKFILTKK